MVKLMRSGLGPGTKGFGTAADNGKVTGLSLSCPCANRRSLCIHRWCQWNINVQLVEIVKIGHLKGVRKSDQYSSLRLSGRDRSVAPRGKEALLPLQPTEFFWEWADREVWEGSRGCKHGNSLRAEPAEGRETLRIQPDTFDNEYELGPGLHGDRLKVCCCTIWRCCPDGAVLHWFWKLGVKWPKRKKQKYNN